MSDQATEISKFVTKPFKGLEAFFDNLVSSKTIPFVWGFLVLHFVTQLGLFDSHSPCTQTSTCYKYLYPIAKMDGILYVMFYTFATVVSAKVLANGFKRHGFTPRALIPFFTYYTAVYGSFLILDNTGILKQYTIPTSHKTTDILKAELSYVLSTFGLVLESNIANIITYSFILMAIM